MIPVSSDEILSRFAGIPVVLKRFLPARRDPSFVQPGSRFAGTKFSHVIASARLGGIKKLIEKYP